jgi:hypothetical protein
LEWGVRHILQLIGDKIGCHMTPHWQSEVNWANVPYPRRTSARRSAPERTTVTYPRRWCQILLPSPRHIVQVRIYLHPTPPQEAPAHLWDLVWFKARLAYIWYLPQSRQSNQKFRNLGTTHPLAIIEVLSLSIRSTGALKKIWFSRLHSCGTISHTHSNTHPCPIVSL